MIFHDHYCVQSSLPPDIYVYNYTYTCSVYIIYHYDLYSHVHFQYAIFPYIA